MILAQIERKIKCKREFHAQVRNSLRAAEEELQQFLTNFKKQIIQLHSFKDHELYLLLEEEISEVVRPTLQEEQRVHLTSALYNKIKIYFYQKKGLEFLLQNTPIDKKRISSLIHALDTHPLSPKLQVKQSFLQKMLFQHAMQIATGEPQDVFQRVFSLACQKGCIASNSKAYERAFQKQYKAKANQIFNKLSKINSVRNKFEEPVMAQCIDNKKPQSHLKLDYLMVRGVLQCLKRGYDVLYEVQFKKLFKIVGRETEELFWGKDIMLEKELLQKNFQHKVQAVNKKLNKMKEFLSINNLSYDCASVTEAVTMFTYLSIILLRKQNQQKQAIELNNNYFQLLMAMAKGFRVLFFAESLVRLVLSTLQDLYRNSYIKKQNISFRYYSYQQPEDAAPFIDTQLESYAICQKNRFMLQRLTEFLTRDIYLLISGFTSQDSQPSELWCNALKYLQGEEVFSYKFRSKKESDLVTSIVRAFFKRTIIQDNIYQQAELNAQESAKNFGFLIPIYFPGCRINIIAFSLGTLVAQEILDNMIKLKSDHLIGKVVLMGGVALPQNIAKLGLRYDITNCWSSSDNVLKYILASIKKEKERIGLQDVQNVRNLDLSQMNLGHLDFNKHYQQILSIALSKQFLATK